MGRTKDGGAIVHISPTSAGVLHNEISLEDWDDEELLRGSRKDRSGRFRGRPPAVVPVKLLAELNRRRFARAYELMTSALGDAAQLLAAIIKDERAPNSDRLRAVEILCDRVLGRPREQIALDVRADGGAPWERVVAAAIVNTDEQAKELGDGEPVEGEFEEEEEILDDTQPWGD